MKYTLDTNVYIDALREPSAAAALARFESAYAPMLYLTAIVAHELLAGAREPGTGPLIQRHLLAPFERRRRIAAPSYAAWKQAGVIRAALTSHGHPAVTGSFVHDILLAATCHEHGLVLVTRNPSDFSRIQGVYPSFAFVQAFP